MKGKLLIAGAIAAIFSITAVSAQSHKDYNGNGYSKDMAFDHWKKNRDGKFHGGSRHLSRHEKKMMEKRRHHEMKHHNRFRHRHGDRF